MQKNEKISVLLAVKDGEKFIAETIQSVLDQTYEDFELIVAVNCSNDNTLNILSSFNDERIKILKSNICQLNYNLNYALSKATGEYIARIDADDIALPDRFEKQIQVLNETNCHVVGTNIKYIDENNNIIGEKKYPEYDLEIRRKIIYKTVIAHPTVMMKKETLLKVGGYLGGKYAQDLDLWIRLMRDKNIKFYNIQEPLVYYRLHADQAKGNSLAFADAAGYFLRESVYSKSFRYFFGAGIYFAKAILK